MNPRQDSIRAQRAKQAAAARQIATDWLKALLEGCDPQEANRRARAAVEVASEHCRNFNPNSQIGHHGRLAGEAGIIAERQAKANEDAARQALFGKRAAA